MHSLKLSLASTNFQSWQPLSLRFPGLFSAFSASLCTCKNITMYYAWCCLPVHAGTSPCVESRCNLHAHACSKSLIENISNRAPPPVVFCKDSVHTHILPCPHRHKEPLWGWRHAFTSLFKALTISFFCPCHQHLTNTDLYDQIHPAWLWVCLKERLPAWKTLFFVYKAYLWDLNASVFLKS